MKEENVIVDKSYAFAWEVSASAAAQREAHIPSKIQNSKFKIRNKVIESLTASGIFEFLILNGELKKQRCGNSWPLFPNSRPSPGCSGSLLSVLLNSSSSIQISRIGSQKLLENSEQRS